MKFSRVCLLLILVPFMAVQGQEISLPEQKAAASFEDSLYHLIDKDKVIIQKGSGKRAKQEQLLAVKRVGTAFHQLNQFDSALHYYNKGLEVARQLKNQEIYSSLNYNISLVHLKTGAYESALKAALIALETDELLENDEHIAASLNSVALIYQEWGIYDKALEYRLRAIEISEKGSNRIDKANGYYNLGSLYLKLGKSNNAVTYFNKAEEAYRILLKEMPTDYSLLQGLSEVIYSKGGLLLVDKKYNDALLLFQEAQTIKSEIADKVGLGNCYSQMGYLYLALNEYEEARQNYFLSLQYKISADDVKGQALVYHRIASLYFQGLNYSQAQSFAQKSIQKAELVGNYEILRENYKLLYQLSRARNEFQQALKFHELHKAYSDSALTENVANKVEELNIRYETEKKDQENEILQGENRIKELTIQKQRSMGFYLMAVIALVLIIVVVLYVLYRSKRRTNTIISYKNNLLGNQNRQIAAQKKEIEVKNKRITDSIQYAKRIQEAMLEDVAILKNNLDDAFIYFRPKDLVSGDFYWWGQVDQKLVVAAIDCTGHGVPGALMSMLGNSFLNQIILNRRITEPAIILEELSKEVQFALKQEETNNRDGMDMALCTIDLNSKQVTFAGAKNPLIVVQNNEAQRIKGDKKPIGYSPYADSAFEQHDVPLEDANAFYLFSDGYIDQFGGEKGRKFMIKRLQSLLQEIHHKPMDEQREVLDATMKEWMKNEDQIDDILIVGFKVKK